MIHFPEPDGTGGFLIKWPAPMSKLLNISSVLVANIKAQSMHHYLPLRYKNTDREQIVETQILLDSGAEGLFMNQTFVKKNQIPMIPLLKPIIPQNVDRTTNQSGKSPIVLGPTSSLMTRNSWPDSSSQTLERAMSF